jgi:hypothetical protein
MKVHQRIPGSKAVCAAASVALALTLVACERSEPTAKPAPAPALPAEPPPQVVVPEKPTLPPEVTADKELAGKVKSALVAERGLNGHGIDVVAKDGIITLYGTAETAGRRDTAARIAGSIAGVKSVENKLAVVAGS